MYCTNCCINATIILTNHVSQLNRTTNFNTKLKYSQSIEHISFPVKQRKYHVK